jgi:hypothetical protein
LIKAFASATRVFCPEDRWPYRVSRRSSISRCLHRAPTFSVEAEEANSPRGRRDEIEEHGDRGGLARAVGAQQAEDFVSAEGEREITHRPRVLESLAHALDPHDLLVHRVRTAAISNTADLGGGVWRSVSA